MSTGNLNDALKLAANGLHVFPCRAGGKEPLGSLAPHGHDDATTDRETIIRWWSKVPDANVGVACAPSGLYVVDIDSHGTRKDGTPKVGGESWAGLTMGREVPATYTVRTQSGGVHMYFRMPEPALKNTASKLGKDIDTRGNGYVVAPPSVVNGRAYTVTNFAPTAILPEWIVDALSPAPLAHKAPIPRDIFDSPAVLAPAGEVVGRVKQLADELTATLEGERNDAASRIAFMVGGYVGAGQIDETTACGTLLDAVAGWDDQPKTQSTIRRQVAEGSKSPRPWEAAGFQGGTTADETDDGSVPLVTEAEEDLPNAASDWGTDDGQARYLMATIGGILFAIGLGWLLWDGQRWLPVDERRVACIVKAFYKKRFDHMIGRYTTTMDMKWNDRAKMYKAFMSSNRLASILKAMERIKPIEAGALDSHPDLLNTPSGVVNLRTGEIGRHRKELLITKVTKGSYRPGFKHADWQAAQNALPVEVARYLQLRIGQAASGYIPESDDALILQGNGANGKSLMTSDGVMRALGDFAMLADPGLILAKDTAGGATPERASVRGARFVLIEELPEGRSLSIEEIKRIIGTSEISARMLYQQQMTFTTSHTLFVTTNYLPGVNETDDGAWRRLCLINFPYRFRSNPTGEDERQGDPGMKQRIREGKDGQHDAIVTWAVEGAMRHFADPTLILEDNRPAPVKGETLEWRKKADRILAYLSARLAPAPAEAVSRSDLYADFCDYLAESGHAKWSQETFHERFGKHEAVRRYGVKVGRTRDHSIIGRPARPAGQEFGSVLKPLPAQPPVYFGLRFQTDDE